MMAFLLRRRQGGSPCVSSSSKERLGLLRDIDPRTATLFSTNISMKRSSLDWLQQRGLLWDAVKKDSQLLNLPAEEYIGKINSNLDVFCSSGEVHGRENLRKYLASLCTTKGNLALFIGGKRVGKSVMLKNLRDLFNFGEKNDEGCMVLYADVRFYDGNLRMALFMEFALLQADFLAGQLLSKEKKGLLIHCFKELYNSWGSKAAFFDLEKLLSREIMSKAASAKLHASLELLCSNVFDRSATALLPALTIIRFFSSFARALNRYPVLVIDEADEALGFAILDISEEFLSGLVRITKKSKEMSAILTSSFQGFPRQLERLNVELFDLTKIFVAGDLSPKETWDLLTNATYFEDRTNNSVEIRRIGMGENLARLCLAAYGGHLWTIKNALIALSIKKADFMALSESPYLGDKILKCLEFRGTRPLLATMARHGFLPGKSGDKAKEMIIACDLGGVLYSQACVVYHVPNTVFQDTGCVWGIIPSYGAERLSIAITLASKREVMK